MNTQKQFKIQHHLKSPKKRKILRNKSNKMCTTHMVKATKYINNNWREYHVHDWKIHRVKTSILLKLIYKFNIIPIKISCRYRQIILEFI